MRTAAPPMLGPGAALGQKTAQIGKADHKYVPPTPQPQQQTQPFSMQAAPTVGTPLGAVGATAGAGEPVGQAAMGGLNKVVQQGPVNQGPSDAPLAVGGLGGGGENQEASGAAYDGIAGALRPGLGARHRPIDSMALAGLGRKIY